MRDRARSNVMGGYSIDRGYLPVAFGEFCEHLLRPIGVFEEFDRGWISTEIGFEFVEFRPVDALRIAEDPIRGDYTRAARPHCPVVDLFLLGLFLSYPTRCEIRFALVGRVRLLGGNLPRLRSLGKRWRIRRGLDLNFWIGCDWRWGGESFQRRDATLIECELLALKIAIS